MPQETLLHSSNIKTELHPYGKDEYDNYITTRFTYNNNNNNNEKYYETLSIPIVSSTCNSRVMNNNNNISDSHPWWRNQNEDISFIHSFSTSTSNNNSNNNIKITSSSTPLYNNTISILGLTRTSFTSTPPLALPSLIRSTCNISNNNNNNNSREHLYCSPNEEDMCEKKRKEMFDIHRGLVKETTSNNNNNNNGDIVAWYKLPYEKESKTTSLTQPYNILTETTVTTIKETNSIDTIHNTNNNNNNNNNNSTKNSPSLEVQHVMERNLINYSKNNDNNIREELTELRRRIEEVEELCKSDFTNIKKKEYFTSSPLQISHKELKENTTTTTSSSNIITDDKLTDKQEILPLSISYKKELNSEEKEKEEFKTKIIKISTPTPPTPEESKGITLERLMHAVRCAKEKAKQQKEKDKDNKEEK